MSNQLDVAERPARDYYQIMHLHPEADGSMVDRSYWHLARRYNAAIPNDPTAAARLDDLNEAYSVLGSPTLRDQYDQGRAAVLSTDEQHGEECAAELGADEPPPLPQAEPEPPLLADMTAQHPEAEVEPALPVGTAVRRLKAPAETPLAVNMGAQRSEAEAEPRLPVETATRRPVAPAEHTLPADTMQRLQALADFESERPKRRRLARLRLPSLPRPSLPRLDIGRLGMPSWQSAVAAAIILVLAPAALVIGEWAFLVTALLVVAVGIAAIRLSRRPSRLPVLPKLHPPAPRGPRLPRVPLHSGRDADRLRQSTKAMLERWQQAADGLSTSESAASVPRRAPCPARPDNQS